LFTHLFFWGFFLAVLIGYAVVYRINRLRTVYLLLVSLFFYFKTSGVFLMLLVFTILSDYAWGTAIYKSQTTWKRKLYLTFSVLINMLLLSYFKYAYFFHQSFNSITGKQTEFINHFTLFSNRFFDTGFSVDKLLLPVGVSFFIFQSLSYTIDLYRRNAEPVKNVFDYGFFVCFFPHLVAGPIVKAHDFLYQIYQPYKLTRFEFGMAVFWIINGFCKKIIADYIAVNYIDRIFDNPNYYTGLETVIGIFGYSLQIYMDFSGYTDIAIGLALVLGYRLKINFKSPYKAVNPGDFWKRWHISLSTWLKEYLYIPLGGNREGTAGSFISIIIILLFLILLSGKLWLIGVFAIMAIVAAIIAFFWKAFRRAVTTNINLMVTMLLGGLWHGSSWLFIIWGGLNGLGIIFHKLWGKISPFKNNNSIAVRIFSILLTLTFISFTRIYFRSRDLYVVNTIFDRISNHFGAELFMKVIEGYRFVLLIILAGYFIHWIPEKVKHNYRSWFASRNPVLMGLFVIIAVIAMYQFMSGEMQPFIYFQF
jgi:alginate O-acetyltransferase complex protein AlgI